MPAYLDALLDLVYPPRCPLCGALTAAGVCETCALTLPFIRGPICGLCGGPARISKETCPDCAGRSLPFASARSAWIFEGAARELIHDLKYRNHKHLARGLAPFLAPLAGEPDLITWVPLARAKKWARGYNQAKLLAKHLAKTTGRPAVSLLVRVRQTADQSGLSPPERRRNVAGAFAPRRIPLIAGKSILIVDDVYTTGATAAECSHVLCTHGAQAVRVLTLARALKR